MNICPHQALRTPTTLAATDAASETVAAAARRLIAAHRSGIPCPPVRDLIGRDDVVAAYLVQQQLNAARVEQGSLVVGRKIGATSEAVQQQLGVDQPDFGVLFDDMQYAQEDAIPLSQLIQPRVEAEIAFVLKNDLADGPLDATQVRAAIDYAVAALEIVDSRIVNWDISFGDTVADNASSGLYVLGTEQRSLRDFEPGEVQMSMRMDGDEVSTGSGAACLGNPVTAVAWLAHQARAFGEPLLAGQVVLSGALGPMRPVVSSASVVAEISDLGSVSARFTS